jgi:hypothetical protein
MERNRKANSPIDRMLVRQDFPAIVWARYAYIDMMQIGA